MLKACIIRGAVLFFILLSLIFDTRIEKVEKKTVSVVYRPSPILRVKPRPEPITVTKAESSKKSGEQKLPAKTQKTFVENKSKRAVVKEKLVKTAKIHDKLVPDTSPKPTKKSLEKTKMVVKPPILCPIKIS